MILTTDKNKELKDDYVNIKYRELTSTIKTIIELCDGECGWIQCESDAATYNIDLNEIFYIEWVDDKCCVCTENNVYNTSLSLKRMQVLLPSDNFIRINKAVVINIWKVKSISSGLNMKLLAELINGEKVLVSRHYRTNLLVAIQNYCKERKS